MVLLSIALNSLDIDQRAIADSVARTSLGRDPGPRQFEPSINGTFRADYEAAWVTVDKFGNINFTTKDPAWKRGVRAAVPPHDGTPFLKRAKDIYQTFRDEPILLAEVLTPGKGKLVQEPSRDTVVIIYPDYRGSDDAGMPWGFRFANETEELRTFHSGRRPLPTHPYFKSQGVKLITDLDKVKNAAVAKLSHYILNDIALQEFIAKSNLKIANVAALQPKLYYRKPTIWSNPLTTGDYEAKDRDAARKEHIEAAEGDLAVPYYEVEVGYELADQNGKVTERGFRIVNIDAETGLPMIIFRPPI